ncbi:MAG: diadenylate cyclase CdaA [Bacteroidales bacterium]|nr:diadenylate cyclase CdaA [Bacteroidales bacterium]MBP5613698.1 diadenylate cyclase CdaA [Bacteroidales bacterium]
MLAFISFLQFGLTDILDICLATLLIYWLFRWLRGTTAVNIFIGILLFYILWKLVVLFHMDLLSEILGQFLNVGLIALIIIFQPEIRNFFLYIGKRNPLRNIDLIREKGENYTEDQIEQIVRACKNMSASKTGALIVMTRENPLDDIIQTGEAIRSEISRELIETIFFKNTPLHDGALVIRNRKMVAARCILPVSQKDNIPSHLGLRHRASIGVTENTDCMTVIVSEQTGNISYCSGGVIHENVGDKGLREMLTKNFGA